MRNSWKIQLMYIRKYVTTCTKMCRPSQVLLIAEAWKVEESKLVGGSKPFPKRLVKWEVVFPKRGR